MKGGSARLATYRLRLAKQGGSMLPRKVVILIDQTYVGDKGNTMSVSESMLTYRTKVKEVY